MSQNILQNTAAIRRNRSKYTQIHDGTGIAIISGGIELGLLTQT
jgi:hypothetical protein